MWRVCHPLSLTTLDKSNQSLFLNRSESLTEMSEFLCVWLFILWLQYALNYSFVKVCGLKKLLVWSALCMRRPHLPLFSTLYRCWTRNSDRVARCGPTRSWNVSARDTFEYCLFCESWNSALFSVPFHCGVFPLRSECLHTTSPYSFFDIALPFLSWQTLYLFNVLLNCHKVQISLFKVKIYWIRDVWI